MHFSLKERLVPFAVALPLVIALRGAVAVSPVLPDPPGAIKPWVGVTARPIVVDEAVTNVNSNGVDITTATVLYVNSVPADHPSSGALMVYTSGGFGFFTYTNTTSTSYTGLALASVGLTGHFVTGNFVMFAQRNGPIRRVATIWCDAEVTTNASSQSAGFQAYVGFSPNYGVQSLGNTSGIMNNNAQIVPYLGFEVVLNLDPHAFYAMRRIQSGAGAAANIVNWFEQDG